MKSEMQNIYWLQEWYRGQCNDEWEHGYGIRITTLDNPGWDVAIDLAETLYENKTFDEIRNLEDDVRWWYAKKENNRFVAASGPLDLDTILSLFRNWIEN